jgi:hypothetical protein
MHPSTHYELMLARTAEFRRQGELHELARAARHARRARRRHRTPSLPRRRAAARRLFRAPRRWQPSRETAS